MPKKRTTRLYIDDDGTVSDRRKARWLINTWLPDQFSLFSGGPVLVDVGRPRRTLAQNAYLWSTVYEAVYQGFRNAGMDEMHMVGPDGEMVKLPMTKNFIHVWFKHKYIQPDKPGEEPTTTTLDRTEMSRYIDQIQEDPDVRRAGIYIPSPDERGVS